MNWWLDDQQMLHMAPEFGNWNQDPCSFFKILYKESEKKFQKKVDSHPCQWKGTFSESSANQLRVFSTAFKNVSCEEQHLTKKRRTRILIPDQARPSYFPTRAELKQDLNKFNLSCIPQQGTQPKPETQMIQPRTRPGDNFELIHSHFRQTEQKIVWSLTELGKLPQFIVKPP